MVDYKAALQSKTIWGTVIAIGATVAQMAGWDLGDTDGLAEQIIAVVGGLLALYGRAVASTRIIK